ncbi:30S ribosome-binding factor RbfA [Clostridiaceae bacterium OttesenSCG-928-D20]|nr:30S ribosome-binding factor RbfA [Clostridiaceae bacterium OttesenSCG-928-D20]
MANNRIYRTNEDIQRVMSELLRGIKDPRVNQTMLSVTRTETTGDLSFCTVYISPLTEIDEKEFMRGIKSAAGYLRRELCQRLSLRHTPELIFKIDKSIARGAEINKIISDLNVSGDSEDDD